MAAPNQTVTFERMLSFHTGVKFVVGHVLAGAVVIIGTVLVTFVCYIAGLTQSPHGIDTPVAVIPEFLTLMSIAAVFAVIASTASFVISVLLTWLRSKKRFPVWLPLIIVPLVAFIVVYLTYGHSKGLQFVGAATGLAFAYFSVYWILLTTSGVVLDFIRRKLSNQT